MLGLRCWTRRVPRARSGSCNSVVYCILKGITVSLVCICHALTWTVRCVSRVCCVMSCMHASVSPACICLLTYHTVPPVHAEQWAVGLPADTVGRCHLHLTPANSSCFQIFTDCCPPGLLWSAFSSPTISWCPDRVTTNLENLDYSGISTNMETWKTRGILCNLGENFEHTK